MLRYIELKSGYSGNGPAWIGYVTPSKSGRTLYFNGRGLLKLKGADRTTDSGNYVDVVTGESLWISGVKKQGSNRHWAGSGKVLIEASAVKEYLEVTSCDSLDESKYDVTRSIAETDVASLHLKANKSYRDHLRIDSSAS